MAIILTVLNFHWKVRIKTIKKRIYTKIKIKQLKKTVAPSRLKLNDISTII